MQPEIIIPLGGAVPPVTGIRSTLIQSSLSTLQKRGHFEHYLKLVDPRHKATLLETLAPEWLSPEAVKARTFGIGVQAGRGQERDCAGYQQR